MGEEKESRDSTCVCLEVGETGWSVWAPGSCCLWVGKESMFQEPATKFLCEHCFLELFPEIDMFFVCIKMFVWLYSGMKGSAVLDFSSCS